MSLVFLYEGLSVPMANLYDIWSGIEALHNKLFPVAMEIEMVAMATTVKFRIFQYLKFAYLRF